MENRPGALMSVALVCFITISTAGCLNGDEDDNEDGDRTITDMLGREVDVPASVERVAAVGAGSLRIMVYLQCTDLVVGVEEIEYQEGRPYAYAHPELGDLPTLGPMHGGDAELIASKEPDVIFWTYTTVSDADDLQEKTNVPVIALEYGDLGEGREVFYRALELVSSVLDRAQRAENFMDFIDETIDELDELGRKSSDDDVPSCYVGGIGYRGAHGMLSTEPAYTPLELVHGTNVAGEVGLEHAFIDKEKLLEWDPDILLVDAGGLSLALDDLEDPSYSTLTALDDGEVYGLLPYNWYSTNYATVLANAYYIGTIIRPGAFGGIDPEEKADEIFTEMVGGGVYSKMAAFYGGFGKIEI